MADDGVRLVKPGMKYEGAQGVTYDSLKKYSWGRKSLYEYFADAINFSELLMLNQSHISIGALKL